MRTKEEMAEYSRERRRKHPERVREIERKSKQRQRRECPERIREIERKSKQRQKLRYPERVMELTRARQLRRKIKARKLVFDHYGNRCVCCGETHWEFLTLDHTNNDGAKRRKDLNIRGGYTTYRWLIRNNFPEGFQLLCMNCNFAKGMQGYCPHKHEEVS